MTPCEARKSGFPAVTSRGSNYWFYSKFGQIWPLTEDFGAIPGANLPRSEPIVAVLRAKPVMRRQGWWAGAVRDSSFAAQADQADEGNSVHAGDACCQYDP
jgi:hypothetical protein